MSFVLWELTQAYVSGACTVMVFIGLRARLPFVWVPALIGPVLTAINIAKQVVQ